MIKKVVVLMNNLVNKRDYRRFGIDIFKKNGFQVEMWCMFELIYPAAKKYDIYYDKIEDNTDELYNITDWKQYFKKLSNLNKKEAFVVSLYPLTNYSKESLMIYGGLRLFNLKYGVVYTNPIIGMDEGIKKDLSFSEKLVSMGQDLLASIFIYKPLYHFLGTKANYNLIPLRNKSKNIFIHTLDYDLFLENKEDICKDNYVVFHDAYYPFHPDYKLWGTSSPIKDIDSYYQKVCNFLQFIEEKYDTEVIIAAHPRANYRDKKDYYQGRKIVYNDTINLVKKCRFSITYPSTSINFIILYNKPFLLITNNEILNNITENKYVKTYSKFFNKEAINLADQFNHLDVDHYLENNSKIYEKFIKLYVKRPNTPEKLFFQVVSEHIKKLNRDRR